MDQLTHAQPGHHVASRAVQRHDSPLETRNLVGEPLAIAAFELTQHDHDRHLALHDRNRGGVGPRTSYQDENEEKAAHASTLSRRAGAAKDYGSNTTCTRAPGQITMAYPTGRPGPSTSRLAQTSTGRVRAACSNDASAAVGSRAVTRVRCRR